MYSMRSLIKSMCAECDVKEVEVPCVKFHHAGHFTTPGCHLITTEERAEKSDDAKISNDAELDNDTGILTL